MGFFRWMLGAPLAALVTIGLFVLMAGLINQPVRTDPPKDAPNISVIAKIKPTQPKPEPPQRPKPIDEPPPPDLRTTEPHGPVGPVVAPPPGPAGEIGLKPRKMGGAVIKIRPAYPENCRSRNAQGRVVVQFDVTDRGEVTNVRIISSDHHCLDRTVIKTVLGWKYPPGAQHGLVESFVFTLTE
jgi:protein TonB